MSNGTSRHLVDEQAPARELALGKRSWWLWGVGVLVLLVSGALFFRVGFESGFWWAGLVDRQGEIRQYYNSTDPDALRRVPRDVRLLLQGY